MDGETYGNGTLLGAALFGALLGGLVGAAASRPAAKRREGAALARGYSLGYRQGWDGGVMEGGRRGVAVERDAAWLAERRRSKATLPDGSR